MWLYSKSKLRVGIIIPPPFYSISPSVTIDKHLVVLVHTKSTFELITARRLSAMDLFIGGLSVSIHALGTASMNLTIGCTARFVHHGLRS